MSLEKSPRPKDAYDSFSTRKGCAAWGTRDATPGLDKIKRKRPLEECHEISHNLLKFCLFGKRSRRDKKKSPSPKDSGKTEIQSYPTAAARL